MPRRSLIKRFTKYILIDLHDVANGNEGAKVYGIYTFGEGCMGDFIDSDFATTTSTTTVNNIHDM